MATRYHRLTIALLIVVFAACTESAVDPLEKIATPNDKTWQWQHPPIPSNFLHDVWADASGTVFAVGAAGTILRRQDGVWETMNAHVDVRLNAVHGSSPDNVIAVGDHGVILRFNGRYWYPMDTGTNYDLEAVWVHSPAVAVATGDAGLRHYLDGKWEWQRGSRVLRDIWGSSPNDIYAVGGSDTLGNPPGLGQVAHYDGVSWNNLTVARDFGGFHSVWGSGPNDVYFAADVVDSLGVSRRTRVHHYDGTTWALHDSIYARDIWGRSATDVYALGSPTMHFDGQNWSPLSCNEIGLDRFSGTATEIISVGADRIATFDGVNCERVAGNRQWFRDVWGSAPNDVYAVGFDGMMHYDGTSWQPMDIGWEGDMSSIDGRSATDITVGVYGGTLHYDGTSWEHTILVPGWSISDTWVDPATPATYAVAGDTAFVFDGTTWRRYGLPVPEMSPDSYGAVWGATADDVFAVGYWGAISHFDGASWTLVETAPRRLFCVWGTAGDDVYVGADGGIMHFDGDTWSFRYPLITQEILGIWGDGSGELFGVGEFGNIIHVTPSYVRYFPHRTSNQLLGVWGSSADNVFAVGRNGTILHYGR